MAQIGWNESNPPDTESAGLGDDRMRSLTTAIRTGLDAEHSWPSAGGDAGVHRLGSARAYFGPQSAVSSSGTDGRLMISSDISHLFGVGSGGTVFFGGPRVISMANHPSGTAPSRHQWAEETGYGITNASGNTVVTWGNSGFSGVPQVFMSLYDPTTIGSIAYLYWSGVGATSGTLNAVTLTAASAVSGAVFGWRSVGSRAL